jgi:hypothetical protein
MNRRLEVLETREALETGETLGSLETLDKRTP